VLIFHKAKDGIFEVHGMCLSVAVTFVNCGQTVRDSPMHIVAI